MRLFRDATKQGRDEAAAGCIKNAPIMTIGALDASSSGKARRRGALPFPFDYWTTFSSVRRLVSLLQPGRVCGVGSSGRLSP